MTSTDKAAPKGAAATSDVRTVDIVFDARARALDAFKSEVTVTSQFSNFSVTLNTDEGRLHGGDGSAPLPIQYFAAGVVTCLMTQMKACAKRLRVDIGDIDMSANFHWQIQQSGRDPYTSHPMGFDIDIEVGGDAPLEDVKRVIEWAKKGCFAERALEEPCPVGHRLKVGDDWIEV